MEKKPKVELRDCSKRNSFGIEILNEKSLMKFSMKSLIESLMKFSLKSLMKSLIKFLDEMINEIPTGILGNLEILTKYQSKIN